MTQFNFQIKIGDTFSIADLDLDKLEKHTLEEYVLFLGKSGDTRSEEQIYNDTFNGLAAEHYMMDTYGYTNDERKYKDLFSPCGVSVEIKTAASEEGLENQINSLKERKNYPKEWGFDISDYVISFLRNGNDYVCYMLWEWNGTDYVQVTEEIDRTEVIRNLDKMPIKQAKDTAKSLLEDWDPKSIGSKASKKKIIFDIDKACTSADVCGIMYRLQLRAEGLGVSNSSWQKHYRNI